MEERVEMETATSGATTQVGRQREIEQLEAIVRQLPVRGGALVIRGAPGTGKSALLATARDRAERVGIRILSLSGARLESEMAFAGLHQLLRPLVDRVDHMWHRNGEPWLGSEQSPVADTLTVGAATLELIADAARTVPLLITVDDAQWLDPQTAEVLGFVARRLGPEPLGLLMAIKDGYESTLPGLSLPELCLEALDQDSAAALLDAHAPQIGGTQRVQILANAAGNPLALVELPFAEPFVQTPFGRPGWLPITSRVREAFAERFWEMPPATRTVLLVASIDERADVGEIMMATTRILHGDRCATVDDLCPAVNARLVQRDHTRIDFAHPLIPAAIYETESVAARRRAHAAMAGVLEDTTRRAWHRAASIVGPDEAVSEKLVELATEKRVWDLPGTQVAALERAADLTGSRTLRHERLVRAAEAAVTHGQRSKAQRLLRMVDPEVCQRLGEPRLLLVNDMLHEGPGRDPNAIGALIDASVASCVDDPKLALRLLQAAAMRSWWGDPGTDLRGRIASTTRRVVAPDDEPKVLSILAATDPEACAETLMRVGSELSPSGCDPEAAFDLGVGLHMIGALDLSQIFLAEAIRKSREQGIMWPLPQALALEAWNATYIGDLSFATQSGEEAVETSIRLGQRQWEAAAQVVLSLIAATRGDQTAAEMLVARAERIALPTNASLVLADAQLTRAIIALGAARYEEAFDHLLRVFDPHDPAHHYVRSRWCVGDLAEAALYAGHIDTARKQFKDCERINHASVSQRLSAAMLYARPLLAEDANAEELFRAGLDQNFVSWPLYRARLLLQYGRWLRRHRQITHARMPLRAARDSFLSLGAAPWAERASEELRASRETLHRGPETSVQLTEQELQIAHMAAEGLSNREIGQRLFVSHRTVGSHLYSIFRKLGIVSRVQLASLFGENQSSVIAS
jgi:DNA-binding CsgD family transcriptional regulator